MKTPDVIDTAEAGRILGVTDRRVRQLIAAKVIPTVGQIGGVFLIPRDGLEAAKKRKTKPGKEKGKHLK